MSVVVDPSGPPCVMALMVSKDCSELSSIVTSRKNVVGVSSGSTTERSVRAADAPSMAAASLRSCGTACRPAR